MRKIILLGFVMVGMILPACSGPIVVFSSDRDGDEEIYTLSSNGGIWMQLTNNSDDDWAPAFSADGSRIAFSSDRDGNPEIYIMNADGTGQIRVTNHPDQDLEPKFSPDGSSLVFWSDRDAVSLGQFEIYLLDLASGTVTRLTDISLTENTTQNREPVFSPDGTKIAFTSFRDGNYDIYLMDADGNNVQQLTTDSATDQLPSFSPDGNTIAFVSARDLNLEIYTMGIDGSHQTRITTTTDQDEGRPHFNADGSQIVYASLIDMVNSEIFIMNAGGTSPVNMTNHSAWDDYPMFVP